MVNATEEERDARGARAPLLHATRSSFLPPQPRIPPHFSSYAVPSSKAPKLSASSAKHVYARCDHCVSHTTRYLLGKNTVTDAKRSGQVSTAHSPAPLSWAVAEAHSSNCLCSELTAWRFVLFLVLYRSFSASAAGRILHAPPATSPMKTDRAAAPVRANLRGAGQEALHQGARDSDRRGQRTGRRLACHSTRTFSLHDL